MLLLKTSPATPSIRRATAVPTVVQGYHAAEYRLISDFRVSAEQSPRTARTSYSAPILSGGIVGCEATATKIRFKIPKLDWWW